MHHLYCLFGVNYLYKWLKNNYLTYTVRPKYLRNKNYIKSLLFCKIEWQRFFVDCG
jgi:hypothetical protein